MWNQKVITFSVILSLSDMCETRAETLTGWQEWEVLGHPLQVDLMVLLGLQELSVWSVLLPYTSSH